MADIAPALTALAIFIFVSMAVMVTLSRRTRERAQESIVNDQATKPRTKRQQQLLASMAPPPNIPTIEELVAQEAAATGVNHIPGGDGLDVSLKLRVYWRDEVVRNGCEDGQLEFRMNGGVLPEAADTDDVRLVCVRAGAEGTVSADHQAEAAAAAAPDDESADAAAPDGDGAA